MLGIDLHSAKPVTRASDLPSCLILAPSRHPSSRPATMLRRTALIDRTSRRTMLSRRCACGNRATGCGDWCAFVSSYRCRERRFLESGQAFSRPPDGIVVSGCRPAQCSSQCLNPGRCEASAAARAGNAEKLRSSRRQRITAKNLNHRTGDPHRDITPIWRLPEKRTFTFPLAPRRTISAFSVLRRRQQRTAADGPAIG